MQKKSITLLLGTRNPHKLEEVAKLFGDASRTGPVLVRVVGVEVLPPGPPVAESGSTFRENARLKALAFAVLAARLAAESRPRWVAADDSGLSVDALGGAPGVLSARYAGEQATHEENNARLIKALARVPPGKRGAEFVCVMACVRLPQGPRAAEEELEVDFYVEGRARGEIAFEPRGEGGFGYDPLFVVPELGKRFAELSPEEKNTLSHRGKAARELRKRILEEMGERTGTGTRKRVGR